MVPAEQIFWDFIKFRHKWKFGLYEFYSHGKWHVPRHNYFSKKKKIKYVYFNACDHYKCFSLKRTKALWIQTEIGEIAC